MLDKGKFIFTSESVSEGHPDKICDRISDAIVDEFIRSDPTSRTAIETLTTTNLVILAGEFATSDNELTANIDTRLKQIASRVIKDIGYEQPGFDWHNFEFINRLHGQSQDIAQGVVRDDESQAGAGDQGIMFGYACNETEQLMPAPICFAHRILQNLSNFRRTEAEGKLLGPDAKSQIALIYENGRPVKADNIVVSTQHSEKATPEQIRDIVIAAIEKTLPDGWMCPHDKIYINPTGKFVIGGPDGDAGLTGRKIIVDTYGGAAPHGGGAFSGKDPSKVDRSAAYAARHLAKNVVAAELADRCTIQIAYAIGMANPLAFYVNLHGTGVVDENVLTKTLPEIFDLTPYGIRKRLNLHLPIYERSANYGHFGQTPDADGGFSWEKTDIADTIKAAINH